MRHPLARLSSRNLAVAAVLAAILSVLLAVLLFAVAEAGPGFHSLSELVWAGTPARTATVVSTWSDAQSQHARRFAVLHGFFVALLFNALALATCWAGRAFDSTLAQAFGVLLAWSAWFCVAAEIPEALSLHRLVRGSVESPWPQIAATSTWLHHLVLYIGLIYVALGILVWIPAGCRRWRHGQRPAGR